MSYAGSIHLISADPFIVHWSPKQLVTVIKDHHNILYFCHKHFLLTSIYFAVSISFNNQYFFLPTSYNKNKIRKAHETKPRDDANKNLPKQHQTKTIKATTPKVHLSAECVDAKKKAQITRRTNQSQINDKNKHKTGNPLVWSAIKVRHLHHHISQLKNRPTQQQLMYIITTLATENIPAPRYIPTNRKDRTLNMLSKGQLKVPIFEAVRQSSRRSN